jgi:predicted DNA-binding protein
MMFGRRKTMTKLIIPVELDKRLAALAAKAHIPKDEYALQLLEELLEDQEDYLEALEVSRRIENGEEKTIPYEEVLKQYKNGHHPH